ncbi:hypothetical protein [Azospirillum sp. B4]|uniref:hypothetical protein n=1 Tax=Azospirillum sp. B4 TaxID=95605 RepID=UPI00034897D5|nr:hypothetical protein [Azospirillum sp. B4]
MIPVGLMSVRLKKVGRDFGVRWGRTLMAFAGLAIGLFIAGAVVAAYSLLRTDLDAGYRRTNPPNLVLRTDAVTPVALLRRLAALPGVTAVEERPVVLARVEAGPGRWLPLELAVVRDFRDLRVATFPPDTSLPADAWPPPTGGLLLERDGRYFMEGGAGALFAPALRRRRRGQGPLHPATSSIRASIPRAWRWCCTATSPRPPSPPGGKGWTAAACC